VGLARSLPRRGHFGSSHFCPTVLKLLTLHSVAMKAVGSLLSAGCLFVLTSAEPGLRGGVGEVVAEEAPKSLAEASRGEVVAEEAPKSLAEASKDVDEHRIGDTFPDVTSGLDVAGPYLEEPHEDEAASPRPAKVGWDNATSLQAAGVVDETWGGSFCTVHKTGFWCDGTTRVRCCKKTLGFVKCGTTLHSSTCGWHVGLNANAASNYYPGYGYPSGGYGHPSGGYGYPSGGAWHIHQGWHQSSFCTAHHTGFFCSRHVSVHCCNDYGHFVDCSVVHQGSSWHC